MLGIPIHPDRYKSARRIAWIVGELLKGSYASVEADAEVLTGHASEGTGGQTRILRS
jgi:hypothetical protein